MMNMDYISSMQDDVLLHILSFLPTKEAGSTSILSKRWINLPKLLQKLDFDPYAWLYSSQLNVRSYELEKIMEDISENLPRFILFVNQTLQLHNPFAHLGRFRINLDWADVGDTDIYCEVDKWIAKAVSLQVQELEIILMSEFDDMYELPACVFNSQTITTLTLKYCGFNYMGLNILNSLRILCLEEVSVADATLRQVIKCCLSLEMLCLGSCSELVSLEGRHVNLKYLEITFCRHLSKLNLEVPNLQSFKFLQYSHSKLPEIIKCSTKNIQMNGIAMDFGRLVSLSLTAKLTNDMVNLLLSKCRQLQNLALVQCTKLKNISIFSNNLKCLELRFCYDLEKVEVDAPNLGFFKYVGKEVVDLSRMNTNCELSAELEFVNDKSFQYDKFKDFVGRFDHAKYVCWVSRTAKEVLIPQDTIENWLPPLYHLKNMKFRAEFPSKRYKQILVGLLSVSVLLEDLKINLDRLIINLKFRPEVSLEVDDFLDVNWSHLPLDHLQQRLIEVEIKNLEGDCDYEIELVKFLCEDTALSGATFDSSLTEWSWKA